MGTKTWRECAAVITTALLAMGASPAVATDQNFTVHNHTERTMKSLYVSPTGAGDWSEDILGQDILDDHTDLEVRFDRGPSQCEWDVRADFADGTSEQVHDVDFCAVSEVTFTR
jgi:hypothetical protein